MAMNNSILRGRSHINEPVNARPVPRRRLMSVRMSQKTVTFTRPFSLNGLDGAQPAGTYTVQTHEESVPRLSLLDWQRTATFIFLPSRPGGAFLEQLVEIDPLELEVAEERDAARA
jgi:hypothetical protein